MLINSLPKFNQSSQRSLKKTDTGFTISVPKYSPTSLQAFSWVGHDVGQSALALLKNYTDPSKNVSGKVYPVVTAQMTFPDLAAMIAKGASQPAIWILN
jgi:hypothetical protein